MEHVLEPSWWLQAYVLSLKLEIRMTAVPDERITSDRFVAIPYLLAHKAQPSTGKYTAFVYESNVEREFNGACGHRINTINNIPERAKETITAARSGRFAASYSYLVMPARLLSDSLRQHGLMTHWT